MKKVNFLAFIAIALIFSSPAIAVPPPPPSPGTLTATQSVIAALTKKDFDGYSHVLADDFVARKSANNEPIDRATWLREMKMAFDNPAFAVTITHVFQGATTIDGQHRSQVMLVERVGNFGSRGGVPSDCCAYYLTETLTLDGDKISRIDRSTLFWSKLSITGGRTDLR